MKNPINLPRAGRRPGDRPRLISTSSSEASSRQLEVYLIVGAALILAQPPLRWDAIVSAIGGRQMRYGAYMLVLVVVVGAILGFVNVIRGEARHPLGPDQGEALLALRPDQEGRPRVSRRRCASPTSSAPAEGP